MDGKERGGKAESLKGFKKDPVRKRSGTYRAQDSCFPRTLERGPATQTQRGGAVSAALSTEPRGRDTARPQQLHLRRSPPVSRRAAWAELREVTAGGQRDAGPAPPPRRRPPR